MRLICAIILLVIFSCNKLDVPKDTPRCIKKLIRNEMKGCLSKVYKYYYNNQVVYLFEPENCPDELYYLYDEDCNLICSPDGGLSGLGDGTCPDFYQSAINQELIWSKE